MTFLDLLAVKKYTIYRLSKESGIAKSTLNDIAKGKTDILNCTGKTLLQISKVLKVSIEELLNLEMEDARTLMPEFLIKSIDNYRKGLREDSTLFDCYEGDLQNSINICDVENLLPKEMVNRIRNRYFENDF